MPAASKKRHYHDPENPDRKFVSVTTALGIEDKPGLRTWYAKMAARRAVEFRAELEARLDPATYREFYKPGKAKARPCPPYPDWVVGKDAEAAYNETVAWLARAAQERTTKAALRGTNLHQIAEDHLAGKPIPDDLDDDQRGVVSSILRFLADERPTVLGTEIRVLNRDHGYAGTLDTLGILPRYERYGPVIWDWKTGSGPYGEWGKQQAAYAFADLQLVTVDDASDRVAPFEGASRELALAVMIGPESYRIVEFRKLGQRYAEFLHAKALYDAPRRPWTLIDPFTEQIRHADSLDALYEIYAQADYRGQWTDELTALAASRKKELTD